MSAFVSVGALQHLSRIVGGGWGARSRSMAPVAAHCPFFAAISQNIRSTRPRRRIYTSRPTAAILAQTHASTLSAMLGPARRRADLAPVALACLLLASAPAVSSRHYSARGAIVDFSKYTHAGVHARARDAAAFILTHRPPARVCTYLDTFNRHFIALNPADVYVFVLGGAAAHAAYVECAGARAGWHIVDLQAHADDLGWVTPPQAGNASEWTVPKWSRDYRRMGHWRLTTQFALAASLGYSTLLQVDDDSYFPAPVTEDVFGSFAGRGLKMAGRVTSADDPETTVGLPELTRYFVVTEDVTPTLLYEHCSPPSLEGLHSPGRGPGAGWDRTTLFGNFVVYDVAFMTEHPVVQRYLRTVLRTGAHFRFRWNEQATLAMVWQLFVGRDEWALFGFAYEHHGGMDGGG